MSKEVVLLDDDDSDEDVQEIVAPSSNNVVDLTAGGVEAVSSSSRKKSNAERRRSAPSKLNSEVQFVGVAAGQSSSTSTNNNSFRNNNDDIVEFAGVKRPRHSETTTSQNNRFSNAPPSQHQLQSFTNNHFASANGTNNTNNTLGGRGGHNNGGAAASSRHSFPNSQFGRGYPNDMLDETIGSSLARFGRGAASNIASMGSSVFNAGLNMLEDVTLPDNSGRNRRNQQQQFGRGRGRGNNGRGSGNSYIDQLLGASGLTNDGHTSTIWERQHEQQRRSSGGQGMMKRKAPPSSKSKGKTEEKPTAMEKGKGLQKPQGFDALDMYYPRLKANERTLILHNMILSISSSSCTTNIQPKFTTKKFIHEWRVKFEKNNSKPTLWSLAKGIADEIIRLQQQVIVDDDNQKMPAKKKKNGKENKSNMKQDNDTDDILVVDSEGIEKKVTMPIGPVSGDILDTLSKYFIAYLNKSKHKTMLDAIEPCQSQENGLTCSICADDFNLQDTVPCGGLDDIHFYCKGCLSSYCTVTVQSGPVQTMACPLPSCKALFATADIKSTLSGKSTLVLLYHMNSCVQYEVSVMKLLY